MPPTGHVPPNGLTDLARSARLIATATECLSVRTIVALLAINAPLALSAKIK